MKHSDIGNKTTKSTYKDFRNFLNNYERNDSCSSSSSTSSMVDSKFNGHSESNGLKSPYSSYNDFLQNYGSKRYTSVRPNLKKVEKKTVRSEIFIQISDPDSAKDQTDFSSYKSEYQNQISSETSYQNRKSISPKIPDNETVPDKFVYAKKAVLQELMKKSPKSDNSDNNQVFKSNYQIPNNVNRNETQRPSNGIPVAPKMPTSNYQIPNNVNRNEAQRPSNGIPVAPKMPTFTTVQATFSKPKQSPSMHNIENVRVPPKFIAQHSQSNNVNLEAHTTTIVPVVDNSNVDKNDPNVKKLVYNTYRGLLGAYNNKANDMVSTLPRKMVVKDQGVSKQLESMALQGNLDKLNGRVNPTAENE